MSTRASWRGPGQQTGLANRDARAAGAISPEREQTGQSLIPGRVMRGKTCR